MADRFHFSAWVYRNADELTPDEVDIWANAGFTAIMSPETSFTSTEKLIPFLDRAQERGIKLIASVHGLDYGAFAGLGEDGYAERFKIAYEKIQVMVNNLYFFFILFILFIFFIHIS